ncbi:MAG: hypothetical protein AAB785_01175, partial [Patescibacteria group bacterium]
PKSAEIWTKNKTILFENTTSSDTHKLDDGTFRIFFMKDSKIVYADSKDATTFDTPQSTGISESQGKFISNPAVLKNAANNWIMIYEEQPMTKPGQKPGAPGPESQRNLMSAISADGKSFTKVGVAIDSAGDDNYFASVPDLIKTPDGKIRMYYVCGGEAICSAISDDGKIWVKEAGVRMGDKAVDPDVLYQDGQWVMYFATLTGDNNRFYKATSADGLQWLKGQEFLKPDSEQGAIVDPDTIEISLGKWRMFFGEMAEGEGQMGGPAQINLYWADFEGEIF